MADNIEILAAYFQRSGVITDFDLSNEVISTIQCGTARQDCVPTSFCKYHDNTNDNISNRNIFYSDYSGRYWMWRNIAPKRKYVGWVMYRKLLDFNSNTLTITRTKENIAKYKPDAARFINFAKADIDLVINKPFYDKPELTVESQFTTYHPVLAPIWYNHIQILKGEQHPFFKFYLASLKKPVFTRFVGLNMMRSELYNEMCSLIFPITFKIEAASWATLQQIPNGYHKPAMGFIIERMFAYFYDWLIQERKIKFKEFPIIEFHR